MRFHSDGATPILTHSYQKLGIGCGAMLILIYVGDYTANTFEDWKASSINILAPFERPAQVTAVNTSLSVVMAA